ncbi:hypothetical protein BSL78_06619 [Apostichopus japonicus]|uniref:Uncharacterized protein n=1 Tax=Stichopus japonicus TaxID=307972 RepID=A0A2G8L887_STIJA|nr:hypothetical protein BSL78_06619 [Apostichopus japonicus]
MVTSTRENEELLLIQIIQTSAVIDLEYFQIGFEIYLAATCQRDSVTGSYDTNSYIFWWSGSQFIRYQTIPSYGARMWHYQLLEGENSLLFLTEKQYPEVVRVFEFDDDNDWVETHVLFEATSGDKTTVAMETFPIDDVIYLALSRNLTARDDFNTYQSNLFSFIEGPKEVTVVPIDAIIECHDYIETHWNKSTRAMHDVYATLNETFKEYGDQEFVGPLALSGDLSVLNIFTVVNLTVEGDHDYNIDPTFIAQVEKNNENLFDLRSWFPNLVSLTGDHVIQGLTVFQSAVDVTDTTIGNISTIYFGGADLDVCVSALPDGYTVDDISSCEGLIDVEGIGANALSLDGDQTIDSHVVFRENVTVHGNVTVDEKINDLAVPDDLLLTFSDQVVEGLITFDSNVTFQSNAWVKGKVNNLNLTSDVVTTSEPSSIGGFKTFNSDVKLEDETRVHDSKTVDQVDLSEFKTMVVLLDELNYIHGNLTFLNETVIEGDVNLANEKINNVNVTLLAEQAVVQLTTQTITDQIVSTPIMVDNLTCDASIEVDGTVNGLDISEDVLLISTNQTISGRVNFTQTVTMDESNILFPSGVKIDSVDVSELDLSTVKLTGPQTFAGKITFAETVKVSDDIVVDGLIDGINVSALNDVALSKSKSQVIPDDLSIAGNIAINSALIVNGTMDNLTTADFIPVDGDTTISGHKSFNNDMTVKGDVTLDDGERVNCEDLTDLASVILLSTGEQTMYASDVWFSGKVQVLGNLTLEGFMHNLEGSIYLSEGVVRGSDLIYDFDLSSLVTLNGKQNITGTKIFHRPVTVFGNMSCTDVNVTGYLQDIQPDEFYYYAVVNDSDRTIEGQKSFSSMTVKDNLNVTGTVDGVDLEVFDNTVVTLDGNQEITGNWMINSSARFENEVGIKETLNEIDIISKHDDTVCREHAQTVKGLKKIIGDVTIIGHLNTGGLINGLDIEELNILYLSKTKKQTLKERKVVLEAAACYDIFLSDGTSFDGVAPEDLALASVDTSIAVTVSFSDDVIMLQDLFVEGFINDVDVVELKNTAIWKNIPQNISGVKIFADRFSVIGNVTTPALVNNIDISELALQAIGQADNATIDVPIFFYGSVKVLGDWNMTGLFHLVDINFIFKDAMLTVGNQTISGDKYFEDPSEVTISTLEVLSDLRTDAQTDGISLRSLLNDTVTASTEQTIEGEVTFATDVSMDSHMIVSGSVDGVDISENVVLISGEQTIAAMTTFKKGFRVLGNLSVSGLVDTVNLEEFDNTRFSLTREQEVEGSWTFEKDIYIENMAIFGKINDIDPVMDPVYKDRNHTITGQKNFVGLVVIDGNAEIITVNGINLYDISNIVLTKGEFHLSDEKTFSSNVTILGDVLRCALVDGFDLPYLWWLQLITSGCLDFSLYTYEQYLSHMCYPVYSLSIAAEGLSIALQYFEDWAEVPNHAAAKVSVGQLEGAKLLAVSESYMSSVPRCIRSELYVCPDDEKECWKLTGNGTLPGSQSIEFVRL